MKFAAAAVVALLAGCGTNRPELPRELAGEASGCEAFGYPEGPYGVDPGDLAQNACFRGFRRPSATGHDAAALEDISLATFYDPTGERYELVLLNSAALWCSVCIVEHDTLPERYAELAPRGLVILSALFQDERAAPADLDDLAAWVETFAINFPMVLDPDYQLGAYASAETAPLNLLIDARSMRIVAKFIGDNATTLWPLVERELADRAASDE